jgi:hypothetical protein
VIVYSNGKNSAAYSMIDFDVSRLSTPWTKDLARWTWQAEKAERIEHVRRELGRARLELDYVSMRLAETSIGRRQRKRRTTADMNARYVKRRYVGKKISDARKAKRAATARSKRACERATTRGDIYAIQAELCNETALNFAVAEIQHRLRK